MKLAAVLSNENLLLRAISRYGRSFTPLALTRRFSDSKVLALKGGALNPGES